MCYCVYLRTSCVLDLKVIVNIIIMYNILYIFICSLRLSLVIKSVPSQGSEGVTGKQCKLEYIKTARKPTLPPDKRGLFSRPDSLGTKGETDGAPRRCGCGQTFAGDQGRQFVRHTLMCMKGSPVGHPKTTVVPGRHVQSQYFAYK